jgi:hypothetical protein
MRRTRATDAEIRRVTSRSAGVTAGAAVVLGSATPAVESVGWRERDIRPRGPPERPIGAAPEVEIVDPRRTRGRQRGRCHAPGGGPWQPATGAASRRSSSSTAADRVDVLCRDAGTSRPA